MNRGRPRPAGPTRLTSLIGRDDLLATVQHLLGRERLVTLAGPGGVGKTRLAIEVADQYHAQHDIPVAVAYLADFTPDALEREVVTALGIIDQSSRDPMDVLIEHLGDKEALLVLDNCEHLLDAVGDLLATLLEEAPGLRVLTTSRRYLEVSGEYICQVPPLPLPAAKGADGVGRDWRASSDDTMALLLDRAESAGRAITDSDDWDAVVALARWSGGLPLVVELIAVRLGGGMAPRTILERLAGGQLLGARGSRRVQPHQKTLRQVLDWSHELCTAGEQRLWGRISVFAGGFDLATAEQVCSGDGIDQYEVIDLLEGLVQQSLVTSTSDGRYHQLQPLREYGQRLLDAAGEADMIRARHCVFFADWAAEAADSWFGPDEVAWLARGHREMPNFRAALHYCATTPGQAETGLVITTNLARLRVSVFYALLGEFCDWFERFLALAPVEPTPARIGAAAMLGWIRLCQGAQAQAATQLTHCHDLVRQLGDAELAPVRFLQGAYAALALDDTTNLAPARLAAVPPLDSTDAPTDLESVQLLLRASELFGEMGEEFCGDQLMALLICALAAGFLAEEEIATKIAEDCMAASEASHAEWMISWAMWAKGLAPLQYGRPAEAVALFQDALSRQIQMGDKWGTTWCAEAIAWGLAKLDPEQYVTAAELLGGAVGLQEATGVRINGLIPFGNARDGAARTVQGRLGVPAYREAYQRGRELTKDEVYQLALRPQASTLPALDGLSERRREVALLIAQGRTNTEIATQLHLSLSTVENHVSDVLRQLGVHNRTQVAALVHGSLPDRDGAAAGRHRTHGLGPASVPVSELERS